MASRVAKGLVAWLMRYYNFNSKSKYSHKLRLSRYLQLNRMRQEGGIARRVPGCERGRPATLLLQLIFDSVME